MTHAFFTPIISGILLVSGVSSIQAEGPYRKLPATVDSHQENFLAK